MYTKQFALIYTLGVAGVFGTMTYHYMRDMFPTDPYINAGLILSRSLVWPLLAPFYVISKGLEYSNKDYKKIYNENKYNKKKEELE